MTTHPDDIMVVQILQKGAPGTGFTAPEATQMRADMDTFLDTTIPQALGDLTDTTTAGAAVGHTLIYDGAQWEPGNPVGALASISQDGVEADTTVTDINFTSGLTVVPGSPGGGVNVLPTYGSTGIANTVARSDHTHTPAIILSPWTFAATGALSSGTRTLATVNVGPLTSLITYDCWARVVVTVRNDGSAGEVDLGLRIGANVSFPRTAHRVRNVGGVDSQHEWVFVRSDANGGAIVGIGATVAVTADIQYVSGDPTNVRHGWVEFFGFPRR